MAIDAGCAARCSRCDVRRSARRELLVPLPVALSVAELLQAGRLTPWASLDDCRVAKAHHARQLERAGLSRRAKFSPPTDAAASPVR